MIAYLTRRLLSTIPVHGDRRRSSSSCCCISRRAIPAAIIAGDNATAEQIAKIRARLGLDEPLIVQFGRWVWQPAAGRSRHLDLLERAGAGR